MNKLLAILVALFAVNSFAEDPVITYEYIPDASAQCQYVAGESEGHVKCVANDGYDISHVVLYSVEEQRQIYSYGTPIGSEDNFIDNIPYKTGFIYKVYSLGRYNYGVSRSANDNVDIVISYDAEPISQAVEGQEIYVSVNPKTGYEVKEVLYETKCANGANVEIELIANGGGLYKFYMPKCAVVFDADVPAIEFSINYSLDGATSNDNPSKYTIESGIVKLNKPVKSDYGFVGWYSDKKFTNQVEELTYEKVLELAKDRKVTLYAKWDKLIVAENDCYKLSTADDLYQFAQIVAGTHKSIEGNQKACGSMQNDIVVNENVLAQFDEKGNLKSGGDVSGFKAWTPIGLGKSFLGEFYGNGFAVKGLYYDGTEDAGLFGWVGDLNQMYKSATVIIDGVGIEDSYMKGDIVGGVVGTAWHAIITNSYNKGIMIGKHVGGSVDHVYAGGIVGHATDVKVKNCYNTGFLEGEMVGGIVAYAANSDELKNSIANSYNVGSLAKIDGAVNPYIGGIVGFKGLSEDRYPAMENNFVLTEENEASFHNGTIAVALHDGTDGSAWAQYVGHDEFPVLAANGEGEIKFDIEYVVEEGSVSDGVARIFTYGTDLILPSGQDIPRRKGCKFGSWHEDPEFNDSPISKIAADAQVTATLEDGKNAWTKKIYANWVCSIKYGPMTVAGDYSSATIDGESTESLDIYEGFQVYGNITFNRKFYAGKYATIMLPLSVCKKAELFTDSKTIAAAEADGNKVNEDDLVKFYEFTGVNNGQVEVEETSAIIEGKPFIIVTSRDVDDLVILTNAYERTYIGRTKYKMVEGGHPIEVISKEPTENNEGGWEFIGTNSYKTWEEGDEEIGVAYGFAGAKDNGDVAIGTFGKIAAGAYIYPMRGYLRYNAPAVKPAPAYAPAASATGSAAVRAQIDLPDEMDVVIVEPDGGRTVIGSINTRTGEFRSNAADRWFDMRGRKLNGKPSVKGTYYKNGKVVIVK